MPDKYDEQIAELLADDPYDREFRDRVRTLWQRGEGLFAFAYNPETRDEPCWKYGCLTMIHDGPEYKAQTPELTEAIRADGRIPDDPDEIEPEHLPVFAEWQRRLDRELNRA